MRRRDQKVEGHNNQNFKEKINKKETISILTNKWCLISERQESLEVTSLTVREESESVNRP